MVDDKDDVTEKGGIVAIFYACLGLKSYQFLT